MTELKTEQKTVFVHIGPHRTGSTSVQRWLHANSRFLSDHGLTFLQTSRTHEAAKLLCAGHFDEAEVALKAIASELSKLPTDKVILSQEDFAGDLPGRVKRKSIYPRLAKNLRVIRRSLAPHRTVFLFFERNSSDWIRSCYHQHLVFRTQFSNFQAFYEGLGGLPVWDNVLKGAIQAVGQRLIRIPYSKDAATGIHSILHVAGFRGANLPSPPLVVNQSPLEDDIRALERINSYSAFPKTAWFAKKLWLAKWSPPPCLAEAEQTGQGGDFPASLALPELLSRSKERVSKQHADDLLPDYDADLEELLFCRLPESITYPNVNRSDMHNQSLILDYHFRGKSAIAKLNALAISYLRRDTPHTEKAAHLFHRIWTEHGVLLVNELSSRWLISTLQTFYDHGQSEAQRLIGAAGFFYANMMKIYEGERAIEGLEQDALLCGVEPTTISRFRGLDRYRIGGTDLLLNTNALALELSVKDGAAGIVLQEFLLRVKNSGNVFTRADSTRLARGIEIDGFLDTWSFFTRPTEAKLRS